MTVQYSTLKNEKLQYRTQLKQSVHNLMHNLTSQYNSILCEQMETSAYVGFVTYSWGY